MISAHSFVVKILLSIYAADRDKKRWNVDCILPWKNERERAGLPKPDCEKLQLRFSFLLWRAYLGCFYRADVGMKSSQSSKPSKYRFTSIVRWIIIELILTITHQIVMQMQYFYFDPVSAENSKAAICLISVELWWWTLIRFGKICQAARRSKGIKNWYLAKLSEWKTYLFPVLYNLAKPQARERELAGNEDPVEIDSSPTLWRDKRG